MRDAPSPLATGTVGAGGVDQPLGQPLNARSQGGDRLRGEGRETKARKMRNC
ncbi:MAG: hypothetical protein K0S78_4144 [Thermomicrobiales bacterium]|nr:hypothetical protein [Thermomicrobiales bacterium]MDF3042944.1 hypothetical protein [Thermomicrobiales bacterium]